MVIILCIAYCADILVQGQFIAKPSQHKQNYIHPKNIVQDTNIIVIRK